MKRSWLGEFAQTCIPVPERSIKGLVCWGHFCYPRGPGAVLRQKQGTLSVRFLETDHAPRFSNHLPLTLTFCIMQVNSLPLMICKPINGCRFPCTGLALVASLNSDYLASTGKPGNARIMQSSLRGTL